MSKQDSDQSSQAWFEELGRLNLVLRYKPKEKKEDVQYKPVRIAVLDTGLNPSYDGSVEDYRDFLNPGDNDNYQDNTGHGTMAVQLIQKVYNTAELYVGRVFEHRSATDSDETAKIIAEAIRCAKNEWKVDIIVLPSGFTSTHDELERAINEAYHEDILIFAAASNYGNATGVAFPARLYVHFKLFCMFSTDTRARAFPRFNPTGLRGARYNFAILGEDIKLDGSEQVWSGTSFATMIGAAIAGRILDFARHKDTRGSIRSDILHTVGGMSAVFNEMVQGVDNGYDCMTPWVLLPEALQSRDDTPGQKRMHQREYIRDTISRALANMHRK